MPTKKSLTPPRASNRIRAFVQDAKDLSSRTVRILNDTESPAGQTVRLEVSGTADQAAVVADAFRKGMLAGAKALASAGTERVQKAAVMGDGSNKRVMLPNGPSPDQTQRDRALFATLYAAQARGMADGKKLATAAVRKQASLRKIADALNGLTSQIPRTVDDYLAGPHGSAVYHSMDAYLSGTEGVPVPAGITGSRAASSFEDDRATLRDLLQGLRENITALHEHHGMEMPEVEEFNSADIPEPDFASSTGRTDPVNPGDLIPKEHADLKQQIAEARDLHGQVTPHLEAMKADQEEQRKADKEAASQ